MVTKSSADSISVLPAEFGRLADAIALVGPPVLKLKLSALAGTATANTLLTRIAETKKRDVITTTSFNRLTPTSIRAHKSHAPFCGKLRFYGFGVRFYVSDIWNFVAEVSDYLKLKSVFVECPLWVKSGHMRCNRQVRFTPKADIRLFR